MNSRAARPVPGEPLPLRLPPLHQAGLRNGIDVRVVERRDLPVVDVQFAVRAGAVHDEADRAGRAHLTADLLDEGAAGRDTIRIAQETESLGASLQTRAGWDHAAGAVHVLSPYLEPALDILADVLLRPDFAEREFLRKQRERLNAIAQERHDARALASQAFARLVYGDRHPYGVSIGGTAATVAGLAADDIRSFYRRRYAPDNAFIVVAGDVDAGAVVRLLDDRFGDWHCPGAETPGPLPPGPAAAATAIHIIDRPGAPQSELRAGHAGPPRNTPDYVPLHLANTLLGGAFTSRLNILLREVKGYTYGAGSSFAFRQGGGPFLASTAVATAATADAVRDIVTELSRLRAEPASPAELDRARRYVVLGLPRTFETTSDVAEHVSELALYDLPSDYYDEYIAQLWRATALDVQSAAQRWLHPAALVIAIAGDASAIRDELEDLGIGEVHVRDDT